MRTVLGIYDRTHVMGELWEEHGFDVRYFDVQNDGQDFRLSTLPTREPFGLWAFPPCDHLAVSGARWWDEKGEGALREALSLADAALRLVALLNPFWWVIENPVGRLRHHYGPPRLTFNPCDYAGYADCPETEAYTKRTCLWGNFRVPRKKPVAPVLGSKMHRLPDNAERKNIRSKTPQGFARAFFYANSGVTP